MDEYFSSGENVLSAFSGEDGAGYVVIGPEGDMPELTGDQIDELTEIELAIWKADQACQDEVGYAEFARQQEQALVDEIIGQFPELAG
jgi:hypothetical protein